MNLVTNRWTAVLRFVGRIRTVVALSASFVPARIVIATNMIVPT